MRRGKLKALGFLLGSALMFGCGGGGGPSIPTDIDIGGPVFKCPAGTQKVVLEPKQANPDPIVIDWFKQQPWWNGKPIGGFNYPSYNYIFVHTFTVPPAGYSNYNIVKAYLEGKLKPMAGDIPQNDTIGLKVMNGITPVASWGIHLGPYNNNPSLFSNQWLQNNYPQGKTFFLDLSSLPPQNSPTDLIQDMNSYGNLSVIVQDDTTVEWLRLTLCVEPPKQSCDCPEGTKAVTLQAGTKDNFDPSQDNPPATYSQNFYNWLLSQQWYTTKPIGGFDYSDVNYYFLLTFNVPQQYSNYAIREACLEGEIKPLGDIHSNDTIGLLVENAQGEISRVWGDSLVNMFNPWTQNVSYTVFLQLSTLNSGAALNSLNTYRNLNILIQDDTSVDYFNLTLCLGKPEEEGRATICVLKFEDANGNGQFDSGEQILPNWTIEISDQNGNVVQSVNTIPSDYTCVTVPAPQTYQVSEVLQSGWVPTNPSGGSTTITVQPGDTVMIEFGNAPERTDDPTKG